MPTNPRHAFVVAYGGGHIAMVIPVCRMLRHRGWRVTLLALTTAAAKARAAGEPFIGFEDLKRHAAPNAAAYGLELCPDADPFGPVSIDETLTYHGVNYAELVVRHGAQEARRLWTEHGRQAFHPVDFMTRVLAEAAPTIVIATNSPRAERATLMAAGKLQIPALCLVDMFAMQEVKWIGQPDFAQCVAVINESVRAMFVAYGRGAHEIVVTGNPAFDFVNGPEVIEAGRVLRVVRGWNDDRQTILWASTVEPERHPFTGELGDPTLPRRVEMALREVVREDERLRLVVRYHPSEQVAFAPDDRVEFSPNSDSLHPLLHAVDLVVVTASTVGLEAWLARRPVISVDCSVFTADAPYATMGVSASAACPKELATMVKGMAGQPVTFPLLGQLPSSSQATTATEAVVAEIEKLVQIQRSS